MPSNDNRQIFRGIAVRVPAGPKAGKVAGKKVKFAQRTLTEADNFDEIECFLTPEEVERLQEPDPYTGLPVWRRLDRQGHRDTRRRARSCRPSIRRPTTRARPAGAAVPQEGRRGVVRARDHG
jgi:hypothetical protein